jgi:hypothetical protein
MSPSKNSLQAVLERQAQPLPVSPSAEQATQVSTAPPPSVAQREKFHRPSRDGRRLIAGHFDPKVAKQLKLLAAEEDTTVQALLEEALNLLFVKKGRGTIKGV